MSQKPSRTVFTLLFSLAALPVPLLSARAQVGVETATSISPQIHIPAAAVLTPSSTESAVQSSPGHQYAPLSEQTINYRDWTFQSLNDGADVGLQSVLRGKRLVMIVYFAPWCSPWKAEASLVARLYHKYKDKGFDIVAVSEYATMAETRSYFESTGGASYAIVVESETRDARDQTTHYHYRQAAGDERRWGLPFHIFLEPAKLDNTGDTLTERAWIVDGGLIEEQVEEFIREKIGISERRPSAKPKADEQYPVRLH
ncbi:MAG: redoxin domain-containing protein [Acidobacteria bacterium]|nr:redoxin domain-containing protein [Acidobacteriota bacterium]